MSPHNKKVMGLIPRLSPRVCLDLLQVHNLLGNNNACRNELAKLCRLVKEATYPPRLQSEISRQWYINNAKPDVNQTNA